jgi:hypothetical protein
VVEEESQAVLNTSENTTSRMQIKNMAEALGTVHMRGRGLLQQCWFPVGPKLVSDQMATAVPEIMDGSTQHGTPISHTSPLYAPTLSWLQVLLNYRNCPVIQIIITGRSALPELCVPYSSRRTISGTPVIHINSKIYRKPEN